MLPQDQDSEEPGPSTRIPRTQNKLKLPVHETRNVSRNPAPAKHIDRPSSAPGRNKAMKTGGSSSLVKPAASAPHSTNREPLRYPQRDAEGSPGSSVAPTNRKNMKKSSSVGPSRHKSRKTSSVTPTSRKNLKKTSSVAPSSRKNQKSKQSIKKSTHGKFTESEMSSSIDWNLEPEPWQRHVDTPDPEEDEIVVVAPMKPRRMSMGKRIVNAAIGFLRRRSIKKEESEIPPPLPKKITPSIKDVRVHALEGGTTVDTMINFIPPRRGNRRPSLLDPEHERSSGSQGALIPKEAMESISAFPEKGGGPHVTHSSSSCSLGSSVSYTPLVEPGLSTAFPSLVSVQGGKQKSIAPSRKRHSHRPSASLEKLPSAKTPKVKCNRPKQKCVPRTEVPVPDPVPTVPPVVPQPKCIHKPKKCKHKLKLDPEPELNSDAMPESQPEDVHAPDSQPYVVSQSQQQAVPDWQQPVPESEPGPAPKPTAGCSKPKKSAIEPKQDYSQYIPDPVPPYAPPSKRSGAGSSKHNKK